MNRKAHNSGFTLIELMIVVAIIGILAVLAIFGVRKYMANAKTAEARNAVGQMAKDATAKWDQETTGTTPLALGGTTGIAHQLCVSATKTVPAAKGSIAGQKYQSNPTEWATDGATNSGFACLHFSVDQPQYYMYNYTSSATNGTPGAAGDTFTAEAQGDLNGDGVLSDFTMAGTVTATAKGELIVALAPSIAETNPTE